MGILADSVTQVLELTAADIAPPPSFGTQIHASHLLGMSNVEQKFVLLLDVDRVLSPAEILRASALEPPASAPGAAP